MLKHFTDTSVTLTAEDFLEPGVVEQLLDIDLLNQDLPVLIEGSLTPDTEPTYTNPGESGDLIDFSVFALALPSKVELSLLLKPTVLNELEQSVFDSHRIYKSYLEQDIKSSAYDTLRKEC